MRVKNVDLLDTGISSWFGARRYNEISERLEQFGIPFSKVYNIEDIKADPHFNERQAIIRLPDPLYGSVPAPCIVPRVVGESLPAPRTGPNVGEHNAEVYAEFGFTELELEELRAAKVI